MECQLCHNKSGTPHAINCRARKEQGEYVRGKEGINRKVDAAIGRKMREILKSRDVAPDGSNRAPTTEDVHSASGPTPNRYQWAWMDAAFDFYRLCEILGVKHHAQAHALKKIIRAGQSIKPIDQDIDETIDALLRWKEMIAEDSRNDGLFQRVSDTRSVSS